MARLVSPGKLALLLHASMRACVRWLSCGPLCCRWGPAPRLRIRQKTDERQQEQFAELAVLNERLAGNSSSAARRRIEWLRVRRKHWRLIFEHVTKQDAAITLAMIEEASQQVQQL